MSVEVDTLIKYSSSSSRLHSLDSWINIAEIEKILSIINVISLIMCLSTKFNFSVSLMAGAQRNGNLSQFTVMDGESGKEENQRSEPTGEERKIYANTNTSTTIRFTLFLIF